MSANKHTPGPWRVGKVRSDCAAHVFNEDGEVVASAHQWPDEEHGPNAHLIAAAPDMLEALEYLRRFIDASRIDVEFVDATIKKARGAP